MDKKKIILNKLKLELDNDKLKKLQGLVDLFDHNKKQYTSTAYDESNTRSDFIDKFFALLDWDLNNDQGYAEQYREVVREDKVEIEGQQKAPDYSFRVGGQKKFFVEAKKPSVNIKDDIGPAFQLRRYAYSANLPLSILTDFEEFAVYDTRIKPNANDKASVARVFYCKFDEYIDNLEYLYNTFSKNAILKGSFDQYVEDKKKQKGTSEVDKEFLKLIETWRSDLAKNIALRNKSLDIYALNESVQKIIDRIIFLRIAEDRNIEKYKTLGEIVKNKNSYKLLAEYFVKADDKYNSGLFKVEDWLNKIKVDDSVLKSIITTLYYPESPYVFSEIPVEIIGQIYEQFLGKTIHLTKSHQAKIEEKPEVRKAGGVYYTPAYIVDYIVKNTVGEMIKNKTPEKVAEINILDPACGSGSFLLGAYNFLLNWHLDYYTDKKRLEKSLKQSKIYNFKNGFKLTFATKKNILTNNLYGVDIDSQAVEVTKLSLLLKLMEDETQESATQLLKFDKQGLLPDLSSNIKCGNSLIGSDFYEGQISLLDDEVKSRKINVFDWEDKEKGFGEIMGRGGFDVVIGNPPYGAALDDTQKQYLHKIFPDVPDYETSNYFMIKSNDLLRDKGLLSFIVPNTFLANKFGKKLRESLLNIFKFVQLQDLSNTSVFEDAKVRTVILVFGKSKEAKSFSCKIGKLKEKLSEIDKNIFEENIDNWLTLFSMDKELLSIIKKIKINSLPLGEYSKISQGLIPYDKYRGHSEETIKNRIWHADHKKDNSYKKELKGGDVRRYELEWNGKNWISYGDWLAAPRKIEFFKDKRILIREITSPDILATYTNEEFYNNPSIINIINFKNIEPLFLLGIINSKLMSFYHTQSSPKAKKGLFPKILVNDVRNLPIKVGAKEIQKSIILKVDQMLEAQKKYHPAKTERDKELHKKKIDILDKQIDGEVYGLYGLGDKDIKIIEGGDV